MKTLLTPFVFLIVASAFYFAGTTEWVIFQSDAMPIAQPYLKDAATILYWVTAASIINRSLNLFLWKGICAKRAKMEIPKLLTDISGLLVWLVVLFISLKISFGIEIAGLLTASGVMIAVIGFALRNMISDLFTGIAMGVEQPIRQGDWIEIDGDVVGEVVEVNWRATRIVTREEITKIIPNSYLATNPFINYSRPEPFFRDKFQIVLGYEVTTHRAERLLLSAVNQITESTSIPRKPELRILEYLEHGVKWELRYWVPDFPSLSGVRYKMQRNVLKNLHYAGVAVAREKLEFLDLAHLREEQNEMSDELAFLRSIELFDPLSFEDLQELHSKMIKRLCLANEPVVIQGDMSNTSLFLVQEGFLNVTINDEDGSETNVGWLAAGMFFGEMSLLTGEKRSANIIPSVDAILLEIRKDDFAPILQKSDALVEKMSVVLANRQARNSQTLEQLSLEKQKNKQEFLSDIMFDKICNFFGLNSKNIATHQ